MTCRSTYQHNEAFEKLNCEGFKILMFNLVPLDLFLCVREWLRFFAFVSSSVLAFESSYV